MKHAKVTTGAVVASALMGLGVAATGTAHAGLNGQQVRVCINGGDYSQIKVEGQNQDGQVQTVTNAASGTGCIPLAGFWWKFRVEISATGSRSGEFGDAHTGCNVPVENPTSDWFECRINAVGPPSPPPGRIIE